MQKAKKGENIWILSKYNNSNGPGINFLVYDQQHNQFVKQNKNFKTWIMKLEVNSAADFLMNLLRLKKVEPLPDNDQLQSFKGSLESLLVLHYRSHWYPDIPIKGSGYRCIRINGKIDPLIAQAGISVGIPPNLLRKMLPSELTLWIDPEEVAYRIGENGSICVLYDSQSRASPSSDLDSTGSTSSNVSTDEFIMDRVGRPDLSASSHDYIDRTTTSSLSPMNSANNSPTKPVSIQDMIPDPRRMNYVPQLPPNYQLHPQQAYQYHRQAMNHNHHPSTQHQQYMQQVQWDGFGNNNKVSFYANNSKFIVFFLLFFFKLFYIIFCILITENQPQEYLSQILTNSNSQTPQLFTYNLQPSCLAWIAL